MPKPKFQNQYEITNNEFLLSFDTEWWVYVDGCVEEKKELTYPEFIKLFEGVDYPGKRYQPLFDHLNSEHGLILHESEMDEIIHIINELDFNQ